MAEVNYGSQGQSNLNTVLGAIGTVSALGNGNLLGNLFGGFGGNVDIDELADVFEKNMTGGKLRVTFPVIGQVGFDVTDIAKIKEYAVNP